MFIDKTIVRSLLQALDSSPVFHPVHFPRQSSGKFGKGGTAKPHRKTKDNIFMANAGDPARLAETYEAEPPSDKAAVIRGMLATLSGIRQQS